MTKGDATPEAQANDAPPRDVASPPAASVAQSARRNPLSLPIDVAWIVNASLLVVAAAWVYLDPAISRAIAPDAARQQNPPHLAAGFWVIACFAISAIAFCFIGLLAGDARHRRLKSWLAFTALLAGWLALATSWQSLAWAGQRWRVGRHIDAIEKIAAPLRANWPQDDGDSSDLGPYSAYPQGRPGALMLLTQPPPGATALPFNTIERTPDGGLAFQLVDNEFGAWLEWHPEGKKPGSFLGGLESRYTLQRSTPVRNGWFLTQYDAKILE